MEIVLATHNKNKLLELTKILDGMFSELRVLTADDVGISDIEENGTTFEENAMIKAKAVWKEGRIAIADDSGLCVNALNGAPGVYSARYAGEPCNSTFNNAKLLSELSNKSDRSAYFNCTIACILPSGKSFTVNGRADGVILNAPSGNGGFGYDPLFFSNDAQKSFAELTMDEKNAVSHRGRALEALRKMLLNEAELF